MKFKIVVVGCGSMSRIWVRYVQSTQDAEIVALVDIHPQATTRLAEEFGLTCGVFTDLQEAITRPAPISFSILPCLKRGNRRSLLLYITAVMCLPKNRWLRHRLKPMRLNRR